jgi:HAE1 family hydrophobic/amphiphilic exporter-1
MIAETFIKRPVTAIVVSIVIVLTGLIALFNLPIAQYPEITPPTVSISANFTGADAETVEQTTTTAIESQINGTPGMTYMTSNSTGSGSSNITVNFEVGTNIDIATLDVQNRASVATPALPDAIKRLGVTVKKRNPSMLMAISLYSPKNTHNPEFINNYTNIFVKDALSRVAGVGDIMARGSDFSMRVWLQPEKLAALNLTTKDVSNAITEQNLQIAAGSIGGSPQPGSQAFEYSVLTNSRLNTVSEFEDIVVRANPADGSFVRLKDVAKVQLGSFDYSSGGYRLENQAAFMLIYQSPGSNALDTYDRILARMEELKKSFPKDLDYAVMTENATVVKASIEEVLHTFVEALLLVVLVVFLFLQNWRATLIPLLAIPVSIIGTFLVFIPLGFTVNTLTMFAFVLAIGIVVYDAIVVVEAVQHKIDHDKMNAKDATRQAMSEISGPVIAIALILAAVFIPISFVPGISGKMYQQFALTIAISVLLSAFVALSLTPALCSIMLKPTPIGERRRSLMNRFFDWFNARFLKLSDRYTNGVSKWIKKTPYVVTLMLVLTFGLALLMKVKPTGFVPLEDEGKLFVSYEMPEGSSITRSRAMFQDLVGRVKTIPGIRVVGGLPGFNILNGSGKSNVGTMFILLEPWDKRKGKELHVQSILKEIVKRTQDIKEANVRVVAPPAIPGLGQANGFTLQLLQTAGADDIKTFEKIGQDFLTKLRSRPEIENAYTFFNTKTPAYKVDVNREMAKKLGVSISDVYSSMSGLLGSQYVNDFNIYGRNFRVVMMADSSSRTNTSDLNKFYVKNNEGNMIPLGTMVTTRLVENPSVIPHFNMNRSIEINGTPKDGYSSGQALEALKEVAAEVLPAGYSYEFSGMSLEEIKAGDSTIYIFAASIIFVFLFLAALYESWSIPFSVLFAVPVGLFGSMLTLYFIPSLTNNIYAQIGMITLIGLSAKNAILIVEFAKEGVDKGQEVVAATLHSVRLRLRPIVMTSMAFILGVVPLMRASGAASESRNTMGWTVFGGMIAATTLAIFIVPVFFVAITKLTHKRAARKALANGTETTTE